MVVLQKSIFCVVLGSFVLSISGCGRKGDPLPPEGAEPFPRHYPAPDDDALSQSSQEVDASHSAFKTELDKDKVGL